MAKNISGLRRGGGRPKGVPNKVTVEVRELAAGLLDDAYRLALSERLHKGTAAPGVETMVWHYAYGKPKETVEHQGVLVDRSSLSADELAAQAERILRRFKDEDSE